jgi:hypothetical protein
MWVDERTATWLIASDLGDSAATAFSSCVKTISTSKEPRLFVYPSKVTQCSLTLVVEYHKGQFGPEQIPITYVATPADFRMNLDKSIRSDGTTAAPIDRLSKGEIRIVVKSRKNASLSDDLVVPPAPPNFKEPPVKEKIGARYAVNYDVGPSNTEAYLYASEDEQIVTQSQKYPSLLDLQHGSLWLKLIPGAKRLISIALLTIGKMGTAIVKTAVRFAKLSVT